jgi:hypothetical protein
MFESCAWVLHEMAHRYTTGYQPAFDWIGFCYQRWQEGWHNLPNLRLPNVLIVDYVG